MELARTLEKILEGPGTFRKIMEHSRRSWNIMEY